MTIYASRVFADTNVLVYAEIATSPFNKQAQSLLQQFATQAEIWVSRQILREYVAALSRPGVVHPPLPMISLIADVQRFAAQYRVAEDGPAVTANWQQLLTVHSIGGRQVHDANIVATMQAYGITDLLTNNTSDFARFASVIQLIPLKP